MTQRVSEETQPIMKLQSRIVAGIAALTLLVVPRIVAAQAALTTADAAAFLGAWSITVESPQGPFEQTLESSDVSGKVAGTLTSAISPDPTAITDIAKDGEDLGAQVQWRLPGQRVHRKTHARAAGYRQGQGDLRHHGRTVRHGRTQA